MPLQFPKIKSSNFTMAKFFLKMKHWQLFLLLYSAYIIFMIYWISQIGKSMHSFFQNGTEPNADHLVQSMLSFFPLLLSIGLIFFFYLFTLLRALHDAQPVELRKGLKFPIFCLGFTVIYIMIINAFSMYIFTNTTHPEDMFNAIHPQAFIIMVPCHFFCIFSMLYVLYKLAKLLKTVEMQREAQGEDFLGEFFLFWMHPIGVWFLQPRINKIFEDKKQGIIE